MPETNPHDALDALLNRLGMPVTALPRYRARSVGQSRRAMTRIALAALLALTLAAGAAAAERWQTLPPTPAPVAGETTGYAPVNGIRLFYAIVGKGPPVVLLHGGSQTRTTGPRPNIRVTGCKVAGDPGSSDPGSSLGLFPDGP